MNLKLSIPTLKKEYNQEYQTLIKYLPIVRKWEEYLYSLYSWRSFITKINFEEEETYVKVSIHLIFNRYFYINFYLNLATEEYFEYETFKKTTFEEIIKKEIECPIY